MIHVDEPSRGPEPAEAPLDVSVLFHRPRLRSSLAVPALLVAAGLTPVLTFPERAGALALAVLPVAAAATIVIRLLRGTTAIGPDGVVDRGVTGTRRWRWDEVGALAPPEDDGKVALLLVDRGGRRHLLVESAAIPWSRATLDRFVEAWTPRARTLGARPGAGAPRRPVAGIVGLAVTAALLTAVAVALVAGSASAPAEGVDGLVRGPTVAGAGCALLAGLSAAGATELFRGRRRRFRPSISIR